MTLVCKWGDGNRKVLIIMVALCMVATSFFAILGRYDDGAQGASTVGTIKVTGGSSKSYSGVQYLLDGDIEVSGANSKLVLTNSTITMSQDVGMNGVIGGGDDHIYHVLVENGGELVMDNTHLTTQTGQIHPYFSLDITVRGSGSKLTMTGSVIEGPGMLLITNQARLFMNRSVICELAKQDKLSYDIDGDGSADDDKDYNDDGIELTLSAGAKAVIYDSQIRDTMSFTLNSRDGRIASNITLDGSGTNMTAVNSFLDIDLESNKSTGSHNILKVQNGAIAHLVGVTINMSSDTSHPAITVMDSSSKVVYYRWIGARSTDAVEIGLESQDFSLYRIDGSQSLTLTSSYLTNDILTYMQRSSTTWARTDKQGWAVVPVITDLFTSESMPNSDAYPDFRISMTSGTQTKSRTVGFMSYPYMGTQGEEIDLLDRYKAGEDVSANLLATTEGDFGFLESVSTPSTSSEFSALGVDMSVTGKKYIQGTTSIVDGVTYPSYYSFDGHLTVNSGGSLTINDTFVAFLTDDGPAYILVQNGGSLVLNNVTLKPTGKNDLYVYVLGTSTPSLQMTSGHLASQAIVARSNANINITSTSFNGMINTVGSGTSVTIRSPSIGLKSVYARNGYLELGGGNLALGSADLKGVTLRIEDSKMTETLDLDTNSMIVNTTYNGTLPTGRTHWIKAIGSAVVQISYKVRAMVEDSVENPIPGAVLHAYRVTSTSTTLVSSVLTDEQAIGTLLLVQDEIRSSGRTFLGNYQINATYSGYSSSPYQANIKGTDIDLKVRIDGGPDINVRYLTVEGALIASNDVLIKANIINEGRFATGPFKVSLSIDSIPKGEVSMDPLGPGAYMDATFNWTAEAGMSNFTIVADFEDAVQETDELNNVWAETDIIGYGPDYAIYIDVGSLTWVFGEERSFDVRVRNVGNVDPEMNPVTVHVEWRKDLSFGQIGDNITLPYIPPGSEEVRTVLWSPFISGLVRISGQVYARFDMTPMDSYDSITIEVKTLPDLRIRSGSFYLDKPIPVTINTNVGVVMDVENSGELPSGPFMVSLYDGSIEPSKLIGDEYSVLNVDPGMSQTVLINWIPGSPPALHDLIVVLDSADQVKEQNEDNNNFTYQVASDTEPDLYFATPIGFSEPAPTDGSNMTIWVHVGNKGRTMAQSAEVRFALDKPDNLIDSLTVDLMPDETINATINWDAGSPGEHSIYIVVDYLLRIAETNEKNNLVSRVILVLTKPDITMEMDDLMVDPSPPLPLGAVSHLNATIWNLGETDAQSVIVTFYDGDPDAGGRIISWKDTQPSVNLDLIEAHKWKKASVQWIPTSGGHHTIFVVMDPLELIQESDEENNVRTWDVYVKTLPDLTFGAMDIYQGNFKIDSSGVGKNVIINVTLINAGDMPAGEFTVTFHNGNPLYEDNTQIIGNENRFPSNRLPGQSILYIEMPWTVEYPKGIRNIFVEAEMTEGEESNVGNNYFTKVFEVFDLADVPEIIPVNETLQIATKYVGLDPLGTGVGFVGLNLSVYLNLTNIGGKAASNMTVLFISENETITTVERIIVLDMIEDGANVSIHGWWNLVSAGRNILRIIADPDNDIREFDEGNNMIVLDIMVLDAPDLSVSLVRIGPGYDAVTGEFSLTKGEVTPVSFEITNHGNYTYNGLEVRFTGDASNDIQTISINPFSKATVTFDVKPLSITEGVWKCQVNPDGTLYESNTKNNEGSMIFVVTEKEEATFPWIIVIIAVVIVALVIFALIYFLVIRAQKGQMAKCSNCGGLVEIDAPVCIHCGIEFSEELECECGTLIPAGAKECPSCHKPVLSMEQVESETEAIGATKTPEETAEVEEVEEGEVEAEEKGKSPMEKQDAVPEKADVAESEMAECFECGAVIPISAPICPHCGAVFE
jgi:subtilase family serine protease/RNA polymerase subunit RPABC4/transcription elongation factor Spt4